MLRFLSRIVAFTFAAVFACADAATADPIQITSGFLTVTGVQDLFSRGFLRSIRYDFSTAEFAVSGAESDGITQSVFSPSLLIPSTYTTGSGSQLAGARAQWTFDAVPSVTPTPFTVSGRLSIFELPGGSPLFNGDIFGAGTATWQFVTTPTGGTVVSGVTYQFENTSPVPEPATVLLIGTGLVGLAGIRRRQNGPARR